MAIDWKETLGKLAPTAATLFGSPFAGLAVGTIIKALGLGNASDHKDPVNAVSEYLINNQLTGEQILALKQAEKDIQKHLDDNNIKLEEIAASDRNSARLREMSIRDNTPKVLAYLLTAGFFGTLSFLMVGKIPETGHDVLLIMVGSLGTAWTGMIAYYYGSSAGSKAKDVTLSGVLKKE